MDKVIFTSTNWLEFWRAMSEALAWVCQIQSVMDEWGKEMARGDDNGVIETE
jgi:hypothetical protein